MPDIPSQEEVLAYIDRFKNWGRWGADDELGTLNLISDDKRREAAGLIRLGRTVSCAWDIGTEVITDVMPAPIRYMVETGQGLYDTDEVPTSGWPQHSRQGTASEFLGVQYHGFRITHLDALSHIFWDGRMYNDRPAEWVTSRYGATHNAITAAREGVLTRGVLFDVAAHRGVPWLEPGEAVYREEIEEFLEVHALELGEGDALLLRTGNGRRRNELGLEVSKVAGGRAGWHANCIPLFYERGISVLGADTAQDAVPTGYAEPRRPIHAVGIASMGLWLLDNANFEPLGAACAELGHYEFAFCAAPIPFVGATGSPVNPLAIF